MAAAGLVVVVGFGAASFLANFTVPDAPMVCQHTSTTSFFLERRAAAATVKKKREVNAIEVCLAQKK